MSKQKKVLIISSEFPPGPGGIGQHSFSLSKSIAEYYDVDVLTSQDYSNPLDKEEFRSKCLEYNVEITLLEDRQTPFYKLLRVIKAINKTLKIKYDRIIVSGQAPLWIGGVLKFLKLSRRVDAFVHGTEITKKNDFRDRLNLWSLNRLDHVYPVSTFTKSLLPKLKVPSKVKVVRNGIHDESYFDQLVEKDLHLVGNPKLLTVGNVTERKGQLKVVEALPAIINHFPLVHYHVVGLPTEKKIIMDRANELGITDYITFHGRVDKNVLSIFYRQCDVFMMLSQKTLSGDVEGFGIAILEANAFGTPSIGAKGCGIEDAIIPGKTGELVNGADPQEVLFALRKILSKIEMYTENTYPWVKRHLWSEIVKEIL